MLLSIIIVNWNTRDLLLRCLRTVVDDCYTFQTEIIVVDNDSTDDSCEAVASNFPQVTIIRNTVNKGFSAANNQAISAASGNYICLINSDIEVQQGCIRSLLNFMEDNLDFGLVGPKVFNGDGSYQLSCRKFPSNWNYFVETVGIHILFRKWFLLSGEYLYLDKIKKPWLVVPTLSGCFLLIRRKVINKIGGLDERFFFYGEDRDYCIRTWKAGWKVAYLTQACVIHHQGSSSSKMPMHFFKELQYSQLLLWKLHCDNQYRFFLFLRYMYFYIRLFNNYIKSIFPHSNKIDYVNQNQMIKSSIDWLNKNAKRITSSDNAFKCVID